MGLTRLWKFEGEEELDDAKQMLKEIKNDFTKLPLSI
jgi:hypothetical protein